MLTLLRQEKIMKIIIRKKQVLLGMLLSSVAITPVLAIDLPDINRVDSPGGIERPERAERPEHAERPE
jgi:hypothetical protein